MQPKNWATSVAVAHLALSSGGNGRWRVAAKRARVVQAAGHAENPAVLAATDAAHRATRRVRHDADRHDAGRAGAPTRRASKDTPLIDFILEVERRRRARDLASTAAFSLDASLARARSRSRRSQALYPYDNTLRAVRITGAQLRDYLEQSARYYRTLRPTAPRRDRSGDSRLQLRHRLGRRLHDRRLEAGRRSASRGSIQGTRRSRRPTVHDGAQQLSADRRRRLRDAERRAGRLRQAAGDPAAADRRSARAAARSRRRTTSRPTGASCRPTAVGTLYRDCVATIARTRMPSARSRSPRTRRAARVRDAAPHHRHERLPRRAGAAAGRARRAARRRGVSSPRRLQRQRTECVSPACETLLLDGGDEFQGTPASNLSFGRPVVDCSIARLRGVARSAITSSTGAATPSAPGCAQARVRVSSAPTCATQTAATSRGSATTPSSRAAR